MDSDEKTPAEHGMDLLEAMQPVVEIASGFKAMLISQGWGKDAAETMAAEFFVTMMRAGAEASNALGQ